MMAFFTHLAELFPQAEPFWEYSNPPGGTVAAGLVFLLLMCAGIAVDIGLAVYLMKRPVRVEDWGRTLAARALPLRMVLVIVATVILLYLLNSVFYSFLFTGGDIGTHTVLFQTLFFHVPVLGVLALLFKVSGVEGRELFGLHWKKLPTRLGLALLFYLAALPLLWFYSMLYQLFLHQIGHEFYLQDVAEVLTAPATGPVRSCLLFIAVIVAPFFEEIIFRGILLPFFVSRAGLFPGVLLVSLLFGGLHMHLPSLLPLFLLSVAFSFAYARTRSLLVPMGMHALFNGVTVLLLLLMNG